MTANKNESEFIAWEPADVQRQITASLGIAPQRFFKDADLWLEEDFGGGDCSIWTQHSANRRMRFQIIAKQDFQLCGLFFAAAVIQRTHASVPCTIGSQFRDGQHVSRGHVVLEGEGDARALLLAERVSLNLMAKLSGICTKTAHMCQLIARACSADSLKEPVLLETRKTTPGLRMYEKYATRTGGARNHRHALDTGLMLKENHLRSFGGLEAALARSVSQSSVLTRTEVEVTNLTEFELALAGGADVIMLDNFAQADVVAAVRSRDASGRSVALELSGNLNEENIARAARLGVDYMSSGALIHQATWVDLSMQLYPLDAQ